MNVQVINGFPLALDECSLLHEGPLEALAWCSTDWRLMLVDDVDDAAYALVPANMQILLPVGVKTYGRADNEEGRFSKITSRPQVT